MPLAVPMEDVNTSMRVDNRPNWIVVGLPWSPKGTVTVISDTGEESS